MTAAEFLALPDTGKRQELLDGRHYVYASPWTRHQQVSMRLIHSLGQVAMSLGKLFPRLDVVLSERDIVQPDLMFISAKRSHVITEANVQGAPDLIIETVGEDTRELDERLKRAIYERNGVGEYWIVDPDANTITLYRRSGASFVRVEVGEVLTTPLLPGFELPLEPLFA